MKKEEQLKQAKSLAVTFLHNLAGRGEQEVVVDYRKLFDIEQI